MKKYYTKVQTDCGDMVLAIRGKDIEEVKSKIYNNYNINKILHISDKPIKSKIDRIETSPLYSYTTINYANTTKRYNSWGWEYGLR